MVLEKDRKENTAMTDRKLKAKRAEANKIDSVMKYARPRKIVELSHWQ